MIRKNLRSRVSSRNSNRKLYESIMRDVVKTVKKHLNEHNDEDYEENPEEVTVYVPSYGECTVMYVFDPDRMGNGDYYEVYDEDNNFICELPFNIDLDDEDELVNMIEDAVETDDIIDDFNDNMNNLYGDEDVDLDYDEDDEYDEDDMIEEKVLNEWDEWDDYDNDNEDNEDNDEEDDDYNQKYTLVGIDGNAFSIMGYVSKCMRQEGMSRQDIENYRKDARTGDYNNLLAVSQDMIDFLNNE